MIISLDQFQILTFVIFFVYVFLETKIYLALWAAIFHVIQIVVKTIFVNNILIYKTVITAYVIIVLASYLYKFKDVLFSDKKYINNGKWEKLSSDKRRQRRIGIAILLLMTINIAAIFLWRN